MIGIQLCSRYEWNCIKEILNIKLVFTYPYGEYFYYKLNNIKCLFYRSGVRKTRSAGACQYIISKFNIDKLFLIGTCGGVSKDLEILDIIIASSTVQYDCLPKEEDSIIYDLLTTDLDNSWINLNMIQYPYTIGKIGTADLPLYDVDTAFKLRKENILCSDCESASVSFVCSLNNVKCCVVRGISDLPFNEENSLELQSQDCINNTSIILDIIIKEIIYKII